ncbi:SRPBCC family protein [Planctomicrobium sp. SH527]|uniref:SRPBCC family protein n=1 Tax=Planctomicrobium sp. SH527 TaxID=3448123 RepID=UPI003F5C731A
MLSTSRVLPFSPDKVFSAFKRPELLAQWWGPNGFSNTFEQFEFVPGGNWVFTMHGPDGKNYHNESSFRDIQSDSKVVIDHISQPRFTLTVTLTAQDEKTHISWVQKFENGEVASRVRAICGPGNEQNLDRLTALLARECSKDHSEKLKA